MPNKYPLEDRFSFLFGVLVALIALATVFLFGGCSLFSSHSESMPVLPVSPEPSVSFQEMERAALRWTDEALGKVVAEGAEPGQPLMQQAQDAVRAGRARMGEPCVPIPLPPTMNERSEPLDTVLKQMPVALLALREDEADYKKDLDEIAKTPLETTTTVGSVSPWMFTWAVPIVLAVVVAGVLGLPIGKWAASGLLSLIRQAKAFRAVLRGVEQFKDTNPDDISREVLGKRLIEATLPKERETIGETKAKLGI